LRRDDSQRPSIIDLTLLNEAASITDQFSDLSISFNIIPSDHTTLTLQWHPVLVVAIQPPPELVGYAIDDDGMIQWKKIFPAIILEPISSIPSLEATAMALHWDIDLASSKVFSKWKAPDLRGVQWWNPLCDAALSIVHISDGGDHTRAIWELRNVLGNAKHEWAHDYLYYATSDTLWTVAKWCNSHVVTRIPPILTPRGPSLDPTDMAEAFCQCFFSATPSPISLDHPDDPPPTAT
jgi:hypothetical protein